MQIINEIPFNLQLATQQGKAQVAINTAASPTVNEQQANKQSTVTNQTGANQDTVTLSAMGISLSAQAQRLSETPPNTPSLPSNGDMLDKYVTYKKAQIKYQIYADMAGMATGNNNGLSPVTAYYLSNNDEARTAVVDAHAQQQHVAAIRTYANISQQANQWHE